MLAFRYDRHEEIVRYIRMWHVYYHLDYHPMVIRVFCLPLKISAVFVISSRRHRVQFNT